MGEDMVNIQNFANVLMKFLDQEINLVAYANKEINVIMKEARKRNIMNVDLVGNTRFINLRRTLEHFDANRLREIRSIVGNATHVHNTLYHGHYFATVSCANGHSHEKMFRLFIKDGRASESDNKLALRIILLAAHQAKFTDDIPLDRYNLRIERLMLAGGIQVHT